MTGRDEVWSNVADAVARGECVQTADVAAMHDDVSRRTVQRVLSVMTDEGWLERSGDGYVGGEKVDALRDATGGDSDSG